MKFFFILALDKYLRDYLMCLEFFRVKHWPLMSATLPNTMVASTVF